jgi:putative transposase
MPNDPRPRRRSLRLPGYDYSQAGAYFITACTQNRIMLFGEVIDDDVRLNEMGTIVQQTWDHLPTHYHGIDLDAFIVMPNHVHGIIILADQSERRHAIPEIVRGFKTFSARRVNEHAGRRGVRWQRGYYEHVIRNEKALDRIRAYIANNPARWADDTSRERYLPKQGGFETRPYHAKERPLGTHGLPVCP